MGLLDILLPFHSAVWTDTWILLLSFVVILMIVDHFNHRKPKNFPSGPTPLPFIGSMFSLSTTRPHIQLTEMSKTYGNIFSLKMGGIWFVVLNSYKTIKEALIDQADTFSGRPPNPVFKKINNCQGIAFNTGYSWKQQRRFTLSTLRTFGVGKNSLETSITDEYNFLQHSIRDTKGKPFDPYCLINNAVSNIICSLVFGRRFEYTDKHFQRLIYLIGRSIQLEGSLWAQCYNSFPQIMEFIPGRHKDLFSYFKEICVFINEEVEKHLADLDPTSSRDYIDCYLHEIEKRKGDPGAGFHKDGLVHIILDLFAAGTETTATTLLWSFIFIIKYPEIQEKVQAEIDRVIGNSRPPTMADRPNMPYTDAVIHEVQRMGNIVPLNVPRMTNDDTTLGGYSIPKGTQIIPNLTALLSEKGQWLSPHSFDPQNFLTPQGQFIKPDAFLPFSAGKRICPGESLARMELFLFFTSILQEFTLTGPTGINPSLDYEFGVTLKPKPFRMTASPRCLKT